jgi:proteasome accessory factor B
VRPYLIEPSLQTHALYLIGFDEDRAAMRTFKIERIREVRVTPRSFQPPEGASLERDLRRGWDIIADQPATDIVLKFSASVADRVLETTWHPLQRTERLTDGTLTWRSTVSGVVEIRLWILSWGEDVEVLEPQDLRDQVRDILERASARYRVMH